jgi:hypothetical protein
MINDIYYAPCLEKNLLLSIYSIMEHSPHLDINFSNNGCSIVNKNRKNMVSMGMEEEVLFQFIEDKNVGLVQQKDDCNFTENSAMMPTSERCHLVGESMVKQGW